MTTTTWKPLLMSFELHPRLQQDCIELGRLSLCRLLLLNDSRYPWFILVPEREGISEVYQLDAADRAALCEESSDLSRRLAESFKADKMNVAALGNLVPQLHIHHIVRYRNDPTWPAPVWGKGEAVAYSAAATDTMRHNIDELLSRDTEHQWRPSDVDLPKQRQTENQSTR